MYGAASDGKGKGVAIGVHNKHDKGAKFEPVSPNTYAANMKINEHKVCAICVYMHHSGHSSDQHEKVNAELKEVISKARRQKRIIILGRDFNAVVGGTQDHESDKWQQTKIRRRYGLG